MLTAHTHIKYLFSTIAWLPFLGNFKHSAAHFALSRIILVITCTFFFINIDITKEYDIIFISDNFSTFEISI